MKVLLLSQWFQPEPFFKGLPFVKALKQKGHEVEVLTGFPNYPGGKVYPGYRVRFYQREKMDGVLVHRVALYPSHDKSAIRRIINYISFSLSAFILGPHLVAKPDVIYVYNLITLGPVAFMLRLLYGAKVIIDVQDLWPESVASSKMIGNKKLLYILNAVCNWVYRQADCLVVLSPGFKRELISRGVGSDKIEVVYNWCDEDSISKHTKMPGTSASLENDGKFVVLFAGAMGTAQGMDTILDCAKLCMEQLPDVFFVLIGGGVDRARTQQRAVDMGLKNVSMLPPRPIEDMGEIFASADALLVHLKDDPLFRITIPSKTQAYLYTGKPIVMAMQGDAADLVCEAGAGIVCESNDHHKMMQSIKVLKDMPATQRRKMGDAGRQYYMEKLSFKCGVNHFERIMESYIEESA